DFAPESGKNYVQGTAMTRRSFFTLTSLVLLISAVALWYLAGRAYRLTSVTIISGGILPRPRPLLSIDDPVLLAEVPSWRRRLAWHAWDVAVYDFQCWLRYGSSNDRALRQGLETFVFVYADGTREEMIADVYQSPFCTVWRESSRAGLLADPP